MHSFYWDVLQEPALTMQVGPADLYHPSMQLHDSDLTCTLNLRISPSLCSRSDLTRLCRLRASFRRRSRRFSR